MSPSALSCRSSSKIGVSNSSNGRAVWPVISRTPFCSSMLKRKTCTVVARTEHAPVTSSAFSSRLRSVAAVRVKVQTRIRSGSTWFFRSRAIRRINVKVLPVPDRREPAAGSLRWKRYSVTDLQDHRSKASHVLRFHGPNFTARFLSIAARVRAMPPRAGVLPRDQADSLAVRLPRNENVQRNA